MNELSTLKLEVVPSPETNDHEVKIWVDGTDLCGALGGMGLDPEDFFGRPLPASGTARIGRCECGSVGCGDLHARIEERGGTVTWSIEGAPRPLHFSPDAYARELERGSSDLTWEPPDRTAARLVRDALASFQPQLSQRGLQYDWASGRLDPAHFAVSLSGVQGQLIVRIANDGDAPARLAERMLELLRSGRF